MEIQANKTLSEVKLINPQRTMVRMICHGCDSYEFNSFLMKTEYPSHMVCVCRDKECRDAAIAGVREKFWSERLVYADEERNRQFMGNLKVMRSSGEIDDNWSLKGILINGIEGIEGIETCNTLKGLHKTVRINDFLEVNPEIGAFITEYYQDMVRYHTEGGMFKDR